MMQESMDVAEFNRISGRVADTKKQDANLGTLTIWLPKLPRLTHPNARTGWRLKANATRAQKECAWIVAKQAMGLAKPWNAATIQITYFTYRPLVDRDNILAWLKASFDALQGIVVNNDSAFTYLPVQIERVKSRDEKCGCMKLEITRTA